MFGKKTTLDMSKLVITSKVSLKMSCLEVCNHDIERAEKLYRYMVDGLDGIPDFDPRELSGFEKVRNIANETMGWFNDHQDDFMRGISIIRSFRGIETPTPIANIDPIPKP